MSTFEACQQWTNSTGRLVEIVAADTLAPGVGVIAYRFVGGSSNVYLRLTSELDEWKLVTP